MEALLHVNMRIVEAGSTTMLQARQTDNGQNMLNGDLPVVFSTLQRPLPVRAELYKTNVFRICDAASRSFISMRCSRMMVLMCDEM